MARIATKSVGIDRVVFTFLNGYEIQAVLTDFSEAMVIKLALHGLSQKVGDSYASAESIDEAIISANAVVQNLEADAWSTKVSRGGKIVEALAAFSGKPLNECLEVYSKMDDKAKAVLRKHPSIKLELATIEARRAKAAAEAVTEEDTTDLGALFT